MYARRTRSFFQSKNAPSNTNSAHMIKSNFTTVSTVSRSVKTVRTNIFAKNGKLHKFATTH